MVNKASRSGGWIKTLGVILVSAMVLYVCAGCSDSTVKGQFPASSEPDLPNSVTVGKLTMGYPADLSIVQDSVDASEYVVDGMTSSQGVLLMNEDYSTAISISEVDDPRCLGVSTMNEFWQKRVSNFAGEGEEAEETYAQFPGLKELAEQTVMSEPELLEINGLRTLKVSWMVQESTRMITYYVEIDGSLAGVAQGTFSESAYQDDSLYFDAIFDSITLAAE